MKCNKLYGRSQTNSPGILTVQCVCSNPKLIFIFVMSRVESISLALISILMFFSITLRIVYYDNACNTVAAALIHLPWVLLTCYIIVDRFHVNVH